MKLSEMQQLNKLLKKLLDERESLCSYCKDLSEQCWCCSTEGMLHFRLDETGQEWDDDDENEM